MPASISNQAFSRRTPEARISQDSDAGSWLRRTEVEVVETSILLPIELFDALKTLASEHEMSLGQMTRLMLALGMSPSAQSELSRRVDAIRGSACVDHLRDEDSPWL
jgi:hypothetical protein